MSTPSDIVVVGGGLAAAKTAEALRLEGHDGTITLVAAEDHLPYERPPLSKDYLAGKASLDDALVHPADWYVKIDVTVRTGVSATAIDAAAHTVTLDDGTTLRYDALILATGSAPRRLPDVHAENVLYLRTVEDSDAIAASFGEGRRLVLVGGGWIGLEVAAAARTAGTEVTVLERADLPLMRILGEKVAGVFADLHRAHGVDLRTGAKVDEIVLSGGRATGVRLAGGEVVDADAVVVGIGAVPATSLAESAGLKVDDGILVDATLRTSDPDIYAVGDIANHDHPVLGQRIRVEHWATALNQPAAAAASLLGTPTPFTNLPYFYSDQYDLGCEYVGNAAGHEEDVVVRGDLAEREFVAFWLDEENHVLAAMNVNVWDVVDQIKPVIAERRVVDRARLADPEVPYGEL